MEPIGYIRSGYKPREGIAPQSKYASEETAAIEMLENTKEGIADILPDLRDYSLLFSQVGRVQTAHAFPQERRSDRGFFDAVAAQT
jgi:tRNA (Thr-GGU) A37 N-methylase